MRLKRNSLLLLALLPALFSCDEKRVFDDYRPLDGTWHKDSILSFEYEQMDTVSPYNLFINIRNNNSYPYNNLFLIVQMEQPDRLTKVDTLEYQMANADGSLMGKGFTDVKESRLWYKENVVFPKQGKYTFRIQHAVRHTGKIVGVEELEGVTDVGFRIESTE